MSRAGDPGRAGFTYLWKYEVAPEDAPAFETLYGPEGAWARLFARSPAYLGTELLRSVDGSHYVTIDRWVDEASHTAFVESHRSEYERLDAAGDGLTRRETFVGSYETGRPATA